MNELLDDARVLFELNDLNNSLMKLNEFLQINNNDINAYLLRARIHNKMQSWGNAMNDYYSVLELESDNIEALLGIEMAKSILGYFTPDMFNP